MTEVLLSYIVCSIDASSSDFRDDTRQEEKMENVETKEKLDYGLLTTYDQSIGLRKLMERALGEPNIRNINWDITQGRFKFGMVGIRTVNLWVEPYLDDETSDQAARRLVATGHTLANPGDLASFLHDHPEEAAKWAWILALSEESRWVYFGSAFVIYAYVSGARRGFSHCDFRDRLNSRDGVLVSSESEI